MDPVEDIATDDDVTELIDSFSDAGGFTAEHLSRAKEILEEMCSSDDCTVFLSFPAAITATGTRGIIREMVEKELVDVLVTTCGTVDHDLARLWEDYYQGGFQADDVQLHRKSINRLGNVFIPNESYGEVLEDNLQPLFSDMYDEGLRDLSTRELLREIGERIRGEERAEESILYWAAENGIPVFIPGPTDGAVGYQLWLFWQDGHRDFRINLMADESSLDEIVNDSERTGALIVGGGISKHHTIWWNQFNGGLDSAVQITSAPEWDGSLSGAKTDEAVSWGKVDEEGKHVTVPGEATVLLPVLISSLQLRSSQHD